ncbi:hypothetical protein C7M84_025381 [Penaeus vannamei]|uniref:SPIN-DOC-like zinc-finger domain-containing protein n=1 Tax=Penaeus vannamei TaxID=6689 RepID=A0A3R7SYH8_PENVA|nr:hypothetical protein C7M84_025381 [Penaeus vannamei]
MATVKKVKLDVRPFQSSWTNDFGFIQQNGRAVCALCREDVVCRTSSVKRHFETKHGKTFKDSADKAEAIQKAVSRYEKQSNAFENQGTSKNKATGGQSNAFENQMTSKNKATEAQSTAFENQRTSKNNATEASYKLALCIAKHGKPFTDGSFIKAAFLECSEVLFDGMSDKHMIISRIKDMPVSARTLERRISEMADNVNAQQTAALTTTPVFSVALVESVDINDIPRLAVFARKCFRGLHIKRRVALTMMRPLPAVQNLNLTLNCTNETEVDWACEAVQSLQPVDNHKGYSVLKFPGATENVAVCRQLLNGLANRGIKVREGLEFTPPVSTVEKQSLKDLCKTQLGWQLDVMEEEDIWTIWWSRKLGST